MPLSGSPSLCALLGWQTEGSICINYCEHCTMHLQAAAICVTGAGQIFYSHQDRFFFRHDICAGLAPPVGSQAGMLDVALSYCLPHVLHHHDNRKAPHPAQQWPQPMQLPSRRACACA